MTVVPFAKTEAVSRFSVAPILGKSSKSRPLHAIVSGRDQVAMFVVDFDTESIES